ncbi:MAG: ParB N-terminal domain-containing protein [Candidatus Asgardarchaeia archaeon]
MPEFVEYRFAEESLKPEVELPVEMISLDDLKPHEELDSVELEAFISSVVSSQTFWKAALVSRESLVILDGHHRWAGLKKLGAKKMPCVLLDYLKNNEIKIFTWYPLVKGSISLLLKVLKEIKEIKIDFIDNKEDAIHLVNTRKAAFAIIHREKNLGFPVITGCEDIFVCQKMVVHDLMEHPELKLAYVDIVDGAEKLLWRGDACAYLYRVAPTKEEVISRASKGFVFAPKTTRHVLPFVPKRINVPLSELFK